MPSADMYPVIRIASAVTAILHVDLAIGKTRCGAREYMCTCDACDVLPLHGALDIISVCQAAFGKMSAAGVALAGC